MRSADAVLLLAKRKRRTRTHLTTRHTNQQDLVGKNLTYLSQLDGLSFELYAGGVLPRLLEQVRVF